MLWSTIAPKKKNKQFKTSFVDFFFIYPLSFFFSHLVLDNMTPLNPVSCLYPVYDPEASSLHEAQSLNCLHTSYWADHKTHWFYWLLYFYRLIAHLSYTRSSCQLFLIMTWQEQITHATDWEIGSSIFIQLSDSPPSRPSHNTFLGADIRISRWPWSFHRNHHKAQMMYSNSCRPSCFPSHLLLTELCFLGLYVNG